MPEKKKTPDRKETYTALAAFAMTLLLMLWNVLANQDRGKTQIKELPEVTPEPTISEGKPNSCSKVSPGRDLGARCMLITSTRSS